MLTILIIILALLWAAIVWSIYSNFIVFHSNFSESENYHKAYYASISALERWELVIKQHQPWYIWSWWTISWIWTWSYSTRSNWWSDWSLSWFSYLSGESETNNSPTVFRTINSRTNRIPKEWEWDVEWMLGSPTSKNYNMMNYENAEIFLFYYDESNQNPYTTTDEININKDPYDDITWIIRLPEKLVSSDFWYLDTGTSLIWNDVNLPRDDAIIDRQIKGKTNDTEDRPFTIYSTQSINWYNKVNYPNDNSFRESDINSPLKFKFGDSKQNIFLDTTADHSDHSEQFWYWPSKLNVISQENSLQNQTFKRILELSKNVQLRFSLLNLLQSSLWYVYPFLEYYIDFNWNNVADKYYTINAEWSFKDYQINTIIQKPTVEESILWNFTSIF